MDKLDMIYLTGTGGVEFGHLRHLHNKTLSLDLVTNRCDPTHTLYGAIWVDINPKEIKSVL